MSKFNGLSILLLLVIYLASCKDDSVTQEQPTGSDKAIPVFNQAYNENYDADKISDIIAEAKGAYVLVDPFEDDVHAEVAKIKELGNQVGAYISAGTGENWRSDFNLLKPFLVSQQWGEWDGEYFVDETTTGILPIMKARIDSIASWGCDWVEFDNMDWVYDDDYRSTYGFKVTIAEAEAYIQALCDYTHQKGMKCMAKNRTEGFDGFDGVLYESYSDEKNWWNVEGAKSFIAAGKLVIINHYNESDCDAVYQEYMDIYGKDISYICEDTNLQRYKHYNKK